MVTKAFYNDKVGGNTLKTFKRVKKMLKKENSNAQNRITGHSTREMFDHYNTIDSEDTRRAINQLQDYLQSVS